MILATLATIVASQAVITGAYSLTRQAIGLGLLPRLEVRFTSESHQGQIYLPRVNALLLLAVVTLVLLFGSSSSLASAYGIAVFGTMVMTTLLACVVISRNWGWGLVKTALTHGAAASHRPDLPVVESVEGLRRRLRSSPHRAADSSSSC